MTKNHAAWAVACALLTLGLPAGAQTLRPGLWELSNKMGGNPELERAQVEMAKQMATMSPQQRKQMEEVMARQGVQLGTGAGGATVIKMCMTKEMAERNSFADQQGGECKTTRNERSGNTLKMAWTCGGDSPSSGEGEFTFLGAEAYRSKTTMKSVQSGKQQTTTMEGAGKWLGTDCGTIKPPTLPKK